ncbi:MAG: TIGR02147 family protein, partial [Proteobacteria bacterium]
RKTAQAKELRLQADQFHLIADWHCFAILSLLETAGAKSKPAWIAQRLGISAAAAEGAMERMARLGLLEEGKTGYRLTGQSFTTSDEIASSAIKKNHSQLLELAKASLERDPLEMRDLLSTTLAIDPAKLPEAKALMGDFREKLSNFLRSGKKQEVYSLQLQLILLSRK